MRREELYLKDIIEAADAISSFLADCSREAFMQDELRRSAVLHKLMIIGEAAARLPKAFCELHPEVEWAEIAGFRNIIVHEYFAVDWAIVWIAATVEAQRLKGQSLQILTADFSQ